MKHKVTLALASSALLAPGAVLAGAAKPASPPRANPPAVKAAKMATLSKAEIRKMLATIEKAEAPEARIVSATCYVSLPRPKRMDYICPKCGEKTIYTKDAGKWHNEIDYCRRLFKELPRHETMKLDESNFCHKCKPGTKAQFHLQIRYYDGTTNIVSGVSSSDLTKLNSFLSGKQSYGVPDTFPDTFPLKSELPRLRQLLGVTNDVANP